MKIFVLSNDPDSGKEIIAFISEFKTLKCVGFSHDLTQLILSIDSSNKADILLIDQDLDKDEMVRLSNFFRTTFKCIFVSRYKEQKNSFFEENQIEYITKPYQFNKLQEIISRCKFDAVNPGEKIIKNYDDHFFIKCDKGKIRRIDVAEIIYIEANQNYITICQLDGSYLTNFTLNGIEKILPGDIFVRVHRSFIINFNKIRAIESNRIVLDKDIFIPIGQSYRKQIYHLFHPKILDISKIA